MGKYNSFGSSGEISGNTPASGDSYTLHISYGNLPIDRSPTITSSDTVNLDENTTEVITVTADDPDGDILSYSISGGSDNSLFTIDSETGVLSFNTAPDYENPRDSDLDNVYELEVAVSDGSNTQTRNLLITVDDVNDMNLTSHLSLPLTI